jgi:hypothetical protein
MVQSFEKRPLRRPIRRWKDNDVVLVSWYAMYTHTSVSEKNNVSTFRTEEKDTNVSEKHTISIFRAEDGDNMVLRNGCYLPTSLYAVVRT